MKNIKTYETSLIYYLFFVFKLLFFYIIIFYNLQNLNIFIINFIIFQNLIQIYIFL
jgi:hypothetical protein